MKGYDESMKHAFFLSLCWALLPTVHVLWDGGILGSPHTDLYPSLWSLWAYPNSSWYHTNLLNYPTGMGWYPPSILHAAFTYPLHFVFETATIYNGMLIFFRFICPLLCYIAARSWKFSESGSLVITVVFACSPFCHGFAMEGIIEGLNAWTIPLWLYFCGHKNHVGMICTFALCCISNWYFGACICVMTVILGFKHQEIRWSFLGLFLVAPFLWMFLEAWQDMTTVQADVRQSMSISWQGFLPNFSPHSTFAKNNYISWILLILLLQFRNKNTWFIAIPILLSLNILGSLPLFEHVRFPYRFHAITLICAGCLVAPHIKKTWLVYAIFVEQCLFGRMAFQIPTQPTSPHASYTMVDGPILHVPGTFSMPAGQPNPSRKRYQEILLAQIQHQQPLINKGDFNSLEGLWSNTDVWLQQDLLFTKTRNPIRNQDIKNLSHIGEVYIAVHPMWLKPQTVQEIKNGRNTELISNQSSKNLLLFKVLAEDL